MFEFHSQRRIEFADTDMAGIVHFARFFVFMETAEHEFLRSLGTNVHFEHDGHEIGWPRLAASCCYHRPAHLGDVVDIRVRVLRKGTKSLTYAFEFRRGETLLAEGEITTICCIIGAGRAKTASAPLRSTPIPSFLAEQIEEAPEPVAAE